MKLKNNVLDYLLASGGVTARELSKHFQEDKHEINSRLYKLKSEGKVRRDENLVWYPVSDSKPLQAGSTQEGPTAAPSDTPIPFNPTQEQLQVVEAPVSSHLFVEAGPGTGKTDTLVARLKHLLAKGGLAPAHVLVLSFSVSAVKELKARIERARTEGDGALAFIEIRTFDSFASRFLRQCMASKDLQQLNYDERIVRATAELQTNKSAVRTLCELKHVFLDEMQDLVGVRADFAFALLSAIRPGFTLFGDSAQGIYDFTIESGPSRTTSGDLLKQIQLVFPDLDNRHSFTRNFRARGNRHLESIAIQGRTLLLESPDNARAFLEQEFAKLGRQGSTGNPAIHPDFLQASTCVICRTNGQVLRLAGQLHQKGIPFQITREKNDYLSPAWLGLMFLGWPDSTVRRQPFLSKAQSAFGIDETAALVLWRNLLSAFQPPGKVEFKIDDLRSALTDGVVMPEHPLYVRNSNVIQLSTIHRSKGLEFCTVIVVMRTNRDGEHAESEDSGPAQGEDKTNDVSEPRVLFVALTRAKKTLHRMEPKARGIWRPHERWIRSFPSASETDFIKLSSIQVGLPSDVDVASFGLGYPNEVEDNQKRLLAIARPGTPVELRFDGTAEGCPRYKIMVVNNNVGRMSSVFGWAVWQTLKTLNPRYKPNQFPKRITGLWVKDITTAVSDIGCEKINRALRTSGLWMALTLDGLGKCEWNDL